MSCGTSVRTPVCTIANEALGMVGMPSPERVTILETGVIRIGTAAAAVAEHTDLRSN
jgi:hypothetical protein